MITKVLMGTLGCVPAYDECFVSGLRKQGMEYRGYSSYSLSGLADFYESKCKKLVEDSDEFKIGDIPYPQMRILDMGFWRIGGGEIR